jgi:hypothetical protein
VSIIPGIENFAPDRTLTSSGQAGSPRRRLAPGTARPVQYAKLPWTLANSPLSIALSPDGTQIAASLNGPLIGSAPTQAEQVLVLSLATGAMLRTWTIDGLVDEVKWTGDGQGLAYMHNGSSISIHHLATPGSDLSAGSTPLISLANSGPSSSALCNTVNGWAVSSDGTTFICSASIAPASGSLPNPTSTGGCTGNAPIYMAFLRFAAGAQQPGTAPVGTDYSATDPCGANSDNAFLWWACPDGTEVIGTMTYPGHNEVGLFADGTYVPLPALGTSLPQETWMIAF